MQTTNNHEYNGWTNYATWNVALWLNADETLYYLAGSYARQERNRRLSYEGFIREHAEMFGEHTPDGVPWLADDVDFDAITEDVLREHLEPCDHEYDSYCGACGLDS